MARNMRDTLAAIDEQDLDGVLAGVTDDVVFTFGNHPASHGQEDMRAGVEAFWASIAGLRHRIQDVWEPEPDVTVLWMLVDYTRLDGHTVTVPCVDIFRWRGDRIADWRIVIDIAPVYAPLGTADEQ